MKYAAHIYVIDELRATAHLWPFGYWTFQIVNQ